MAELHIRIRALLAIAFPKEPIPPPIVDDAIHVIESTLTLYSADPLRAMIGYDDGTSLLLPSSIGSALKLQVEIVGDGPNVSYNGHQFVPIHFRLVDVPGYAVSTIAYGGGSRVSELQQQLVHGQRLFEAVIVPITVPGDAGYESTVYYIDALSPVHSALQIIRATASEVVALDQPHETMTLTEYRNIIAPFFGIRNLAGSPRLAAAVDGLVLMSVSRRPIHCLNISPPGDAKGMLQRVCREICSRYFYIGGKNSQAGIVGSARQSKGRAFAQPGYLKLADGGVLGIADIHNLLVGKHEGLVHILAEAMEEGRACDSTTNRVEYQFNTSLLVDANPSSTVGGNGPELRIPDNLMSRFTLIFHFDYTFADTVATAAQLLSPTAQDDIQVRQLKVRLAWLKDQSPPQWSDEAEVAARALLHQLIADWDHVDQTQLRSHLNRSMKGLMTLATAHAILRRSDTVTTADIEAVTHLMQLRFESLREVLAHRAGSVEPVALKAGRQMALRREFAGQTVRFAAVEQFYALREWKVTRKTAFRDIQDIVQAGAAKRSWGKITFMPATDRAVGPTLAPLSEG